MNIFRLRVTTDRQPRSKNGHPPHSTTGVLSSSCNQPWGPEPSHCTSGTPIMGNMARRRSGTVSMAATRSRRAMSVSSGSSACSPAWAVFGSNAMPQMGHVPGPTCSTCGCIGQV